MRNMLALVGLVVVGFGALGWYCGWYKLNVSKGTDGKPEIRTTVDTDKVVDDSSSFFKKVGQLIEQKASQSGKDAQPAGSPETKTEPAKDSPGGWFFGPAAGEKDR